MEVFGSGEGIQGRLLWGCLFWGVGGKGGRARVERIGFLVGNAERMECSTAGLLVDVQLSID